MVIWQSTCVPLFELDVSLNFVVTLLGELLELLTFVEIFVWLSCVTDGAVRCRLTEGNIGTDGIGLRYRFMVRRGVRTAEQ